MIRTKGIHANTSGSHLAAQIAMQDNTDETLLGIGRSLAGGIAQIATNRRRAEEQAKAEAKESRAEAIAAEKEAWDRQQWLATQTGEIPAEMEAAATAPTTTWPTRTKGIKPG